jgi:hypothetical protein
MDLIDQPDRNRQSIEKFHAMFEGAYIVGHFCDITSGASLS